MIWKGENRQAVQRIVSSFRKLAVMTGFPVLDPVALRHRLSTILPFRWGRGELLFFHRYHYSMLRPVFQSFQQVL